MLAFFTVVIVGIVAYVYWHEGLLTAVAMLFNVVVAGLVAFNFWEPVADFVEPMTAGSLLAGYEDALSLTALFAGTLAVLRVLTNQLAITDLEYPLALQRAGCAVAGGLTGYLAAGFLACVLQTLPWQQNFLGFKYEIDPTQPASVNTLRRLLPADRVWLALMRRAGSYAFAGDVDPRAASEDADDRFKTFDKYATFELRYARYRRHSADGEFPRPYTGELNREIYR